MIRKTYLAAACMVGLASAAAMAQQAPERVGVHSDWHVFVVDNPRECFAVSKPVKTVNSRRGVAVSNVKRDEIRLFVFYRPTQNVKGQVTFTGGYGFDASKSVEMDVDGKKFSFSSKGEWAWPITADEDAKIVDAMRRGSKAIITAQSPRPTVTEDTFSLTGFTAAIADANKRCSG